MFTYNSMTKWTLYRYRLKDRQSGGLSSCSSVRWVGSVMHCSLLEHFWQTLLQASSSRCQSLRKCIVTIRQACLMIIQTLNTRGVTHKWVNVPSCLKRSNVWVISHIDLVFVWRSKTLIPCGKISSPCVQSSSLTTLFAPFSACYAAGVNVAKEEKTCGKILIYTIRPY